VTTLLLVHGAFHGAWCWDRLLPELSSRDVKARAVELPFTTLADDEAAVVAEIAALADQSEQVVLLGHSFGGVVISGAGAQGSTPRPGVARLVYLAAVLTGPGEDVAIDPSPGMAALRFEDDRARIDAGGSTDAFYHRCSDEDAAWATGHLRSMPAALLTTPSSAFAWQVLPSTYIVCDDDRMVGPDAQRRMAANATSSIEISSEHSPFLSCPAALADVLAPIVAAV